MIEEINLNFGDEAEEEFFLKPVKKMRKHHSVYGDLQAIQNALKITIQDDVGDENDFLPGEGRYYSQLLNSLDYPKNLKDEIISKLKIKRESASGSIPKKKKRNSDSVETNEKTRISRPCMSSPLLQEEEKQSNKVKLRLKKIKKPLIEEQQKSPSPKTKPKLKLKLKKKSPPLPTPKLPEFSSLFSLPSHLSPPFLPIYFCSAALPLPSFSGGVEVTPLKIERASIPPTLVSPLPSPLPPVSMHNQQPLTVKTGFDRMWPVRTCNEVRKCKSEAGRNELEMEAQERAIKEYASEGEVGDEEMELLGFAFL